MKKLSSSLLALALFIFSSVQAFAQQGDGGGIINPVIKTLGDDPIAAAEGTTFQRYFIFLWQALISIGALLVLIYFIWGAVEWITAAGDSGKVQKARDRIIQAVIGLIVLVGSFVIIGWISTIFFGEDFNILQLQFTTPTP